MITDNKITKAAPGAILNDKVVPGLELYCGKKRKTFRLRVRINNSERRITLGYYPIISLEDARALAYEELGKYLKGKPLHKDITLGELWNEFRIHHISKRKSATQKQYESLWDLYLSAFCDRQAMSIKRNEVATLFETLAPVSGNRLLAVISKLYSFGYAYEYISNEHNPANGITRNVERARERTATDCELKRINARLNVWLCSKRKCERQYARLFYTLLFTGARKSELANARQSQIDFENSLLILDDSKTGAKKVTLPLECHQYIKDAINEGDYLVFSYKNHNRQSSKFFEECQVEDITLHDLRRTYGTIALEEGCSMEEVAAMLGHASINTTERVYARIRSDKKEELGNSITTKLIERLGAS